MDVKGFVMGGDGEPLAGAMVYVFTAEPKDGKSTVCPSCHPDCSKQAVTDATGKFVLPALDTDLEFRLLAVARGHLPRYMKNVDPEAGEAHASLKPVLFPTAKAEHRITGKLLDPEGNPVAGAMVEVEGARFGPYSYSSVQGKADSVAATDANGEFLFTCKDDLQGLLVTFKPRRLARQKMWLDPGRSYLIALKSGVTVKGRLVNEGRPVSELTLTMSTQERNMESHLGNIQIATDEEGHFTLPNVPAKTAFWINTLMKEVVGVGSTLAPRVVTTGEDGSVLELGDLSMKPALHLTGRVVLSDGKRLPGETTIGFGLEDAGDSTQVKADDEGEFEIQGIPPTRVGLWVRVPGYRISAKNPNKDWLNEGRIMGVMSGSLDDFTIHLEPGERFAQGEGPGDPDRYPRDKPLKGADVK